MSVARRYPMLFGKYLLTPRELQDLQDFVAKYYHAWHAASGMAGGLTTGYNSLKLKYAAAINLLAAAPTPHATQRISTREATVMAQLRSVKQEYAGHLEQERHIKEDFVTATTLGELMARKRTGQQFNKLLEEIGFQVRIDGGWSKDAARYENPRWEPTALGKPYCKSTLYFPSGKTAPTVVLRWEKKSTLLAVVGQGGLVA